MRSGHLFTSDRWRRDLFGHSPTTGLPADISRDSATGAEQVSTFQATHDREGDLWLVSQQGLFHSSDSGATFSQTRWERFARRDAEHGQSARRPNLSRHFSPSVARAKRARFGARIIRAKAGFASTTNSTNTATVSAASPPIRKPLVASTSAPMGAAFSTANQSARTIESEVWKAPLFI